VGRLAMADQTDDMKSLDDAMAKFEGNFLESADLMHDPPVRVVISAVAPPNTERDSAKKLIDKPILDFQGAKKRFILGKTNKRILKAWHGKKASGWIGKEIVIGVRYLKESFGQKNMPTLRIIPPKDVPLPKAARDFFGQETPYKD
jgi:hypothetical protein